jgi:hypothetical protein
MRENKKYLDERHPIEVERRRLIDGKINQFSNFKDVSTYRTTLITQTQS